jgi:NAD(P)-dependent dehydrogenase (short-subunit alcohol dehydrogenase family)
MAGNRKFIPINELISLTGKKALVTGGAMGIGFAIAYRLAESGATVTVADLNEDKGQKVVQDLNSYGFKTSFIRCDVSQEDEVVRTVSTAVSNMGGLDILVNNAGIFPPTPLFQLTSEMLEKVLAINLKGTAYFCREVGRWMVENKHSGSIINIASINSLTPSTKGMIAYDASKGGVWMLTKSVASELGRNGVRVNAIAPGSILTEGVLMMSAGGSREASRAFTARLPLGKMGVADDIGRVALFLASDLSSYMTGAMVAVDGGYLIS